MKALRHSLIFMLMTAIFLSGGLSRKVQAGIEAQTWLVQPVTAQGQSGIITNIQYIDEFGGDVIHASMADENGNLYLAGLTSYSWRDPIHPHSGGQRDIVVMKLDNQGNYVWHTFFGGSGDDYSTAITVDSSGVYVIGIAPGDMGYPPLHPASSDGDFMILKLDLNGAYLWHTYYPDNPSGISAIALDSQGGLFFAGMSTHAWGSPMPGVHPCLGFTHLSTLGLSQEFDPL